MDVSAYTKQTGTFLKAEDVSKMPMWTIASEGMLETSKKFGNERLHITVVSGEEERTFDMSKTNARAVEKKLGTNTSNWIGHKLTLEVYKTKTSDGKLVDAINCKSID